MRFLALIAATLFASVAQAQDWTDLNKIFGPRAVASGKTYVVERLRTDLQIQNSSGMVIPPEMGLRSTAVFDRDGAVKGDICLQRIEFDSVINDLREGGISITALGARFAGTDPGVYFLEFQGSGKLDDLARTLKGALDELGKVSLINEGLNRTGNTPTVDWMMVSNALGLPVKPVGASRVMRAATGGSWVSFGGCPCGRTMMAGELEVESGKLQTVIDLLRGREISVTAIRRLEIGFALDFESEGDAVRLAQWMRKPFGLSAKR